ncbi:MAG: nicotinate (nicotinamide) nucleotide adenylyltransferase [Flavobacteriales bacterium]
MKQIGLYFGSFNPIHIGHLVIANFVANYTEIDEVWMIVTPHNPHKEKGSLAPEQDRLKMVELATFDNLKVWAKDIEFNLPQPNYTINTLNHLKEEHPDASFTLMMGEDNLKSLHKWKSYEEIISNYNILVYPRAQEEGKQVSKDQNVDMSRITMCQAPVMNISSTFVRNCIKNQKDIRYLVVDEVIEYISEHKLYEAQ